LDYKRKSKFFKYKVWENLVSDVFSTHHGAFIERQVSEDNGAYWLDDIEDWAGSVFDLENDLIGKISLIFRVNELETLSSSENASIPSNETSSENFTQNFSSASGMRLPTPNSKVMFGNERFEDQIFFGNFLLNITSMNISDTSMCFF
jgi:hypothetical protein